MLGGLGNLANMLKSAKEMQEKMAQVQAEMAQKRFTAEAGAGAVTAVADGYGTLVDIKISASAAEDVELLEDLVKAAVGAAANKAREEMKAEFSKMTGGMDIPGLSDLLGKQ